MGEGREKIPAASAAYLNQGMEPTAYSVGSCVRQRLSPSVQIDDTTTDSTSRKPHNAALVDIRDWVTMAQSLMDDAPCLDTTSLMSKDIVRLQILQPMT